MKKDVDVPPGNDGRAAIGSVTRHSAAEKMGYYQDAFCGAMDGQRLARRSTGFVLTSSAAASDPSPAVGAVLSLQ